jgi:hypothetical protein
MPWDTQGVSGSKGTMAHDFHQLWMLLHWEHLVKNTHLESSRISWCCFFQYPASRIRTPWFDYIPGIITQSLPRPKPKTWFSLAVWRRVKQGETGHDMSIRGYTLDIKTIINLY